MYINLQNKERDVCNNKKFNLFTSKVKALQIVTKASFNKRNNKKKFLVIK